MFNQVKFVECIREQLTERGFGKKKADELIERFNGLTSNYMQSGSAVDAGFRAQAQLFSELEDAAAEKAKRSMSDLLKVADAVDRFERFNQNTKIFGKGVNEAAGPARIAISFIEDDPRAGAIAYTTERDTTKGRLWSVMGDILEKFDKGAFGKQRGEAHFPNVVREIFGEDTGDLAARELAVGWRKVQETSVDLFNNAGGSMKKLADWNLPQSRSMAKVVKDGPDAFVRFHLEKLDWSRTVWPDGTPIAPAQREGFLREVYRTQSSGGVNKIDPNAVGGRGRAVGNAMEEHRLLHYDGPEAWMEAHQRYGEGGIFDVMIRHVDDMAHRIALVQTFGSNPSNMAETIKAMALKRAEELDNAKPVAKGRTRVAETEALLKNRFDPMFETITRANPMDPESGLGNAVVGASNILTSAQLGAASLLAIPGDFATVASVRALNGMGLFDGISTYFKTLATDKAFQRSIAVQSGFIHEEAVSAVYASQRFTGIATVGPALTKRVSDVVMRASLLSGHTSAARWTVQSEFMGLLSRSAGTAFDDLPFDMVAKRYGITAAEWDAFRTGVQPFRPRDGVDFLRPIDILKTELPNKDELYRKFQGMILEESRKMVPEGTVEGSVGLRDTTRPDTVPGALLYSFSMYKNFPLSMMMTYGRLAMTNPDRAGRLGFVAGLGAGMVLVGAMGTQMREVSKGRDPMPMDNLKFWGKAALSGGALSIWGDMLFSGINQFGRGPGEAAAGPVVGLVGDTAQLAFGDLFAIADAAGTLKADPESKTLSKAVEFAKRYTPGSSLWYARLALERQVFDRLSELADPKAYSNFQRRQRNQKRDQGNDYWWAPGDRAPSRGPELTRSR